MSDNILGEYMLQQDRARQRKQGKVDFARLLIRRVASDEHTSTYYKNKTIEMIEEEVAKVLPCGEMCTSCKESYTGGLMCAKCKNGNEWHR